MVFSEKSSKKAFVMGAFAEFERALIHERQREGIALAKAGSVQGAEEILSKA
jgi:DNA invertase Pin-like site-specific DNA recombinase